MLMTPETRRTEASLGNLLCYAYRRRVADFEECLAAFGAEGELELINSTVRELAKVINSALTEQMLVRVTRHPEHPHSYTSRRGEKKGGVLGLS